jgi:galactokinase
LRDVPPEAVEGLADPVLRRRARHVVTENLRVLASLGCIGDRDWESLAGLLDASHASMRDDFEISCAELDLAVESARAAGALGARMTGGGFGGSAVALIPRTAVDAVQSAVTSAFARAGHAEPAFLVATPGVAARVESVS